MQLKDADFACERLKVLVDLDQRFEALMEGIEFLREFPPRHPIKDRLLIHAMRDAWRVSGVRQNIDDLRNGLDALAEQVSAA